MKYRHNSTIGVKERECISCGKKCFWFSKKRCKECSTIEDTMKRMEQQTESIIEEEDLGDLIADADAIFSQYIRLKYVDKDGKVKCFTCDIVKHWTMMQAGHYIGRAHLYLRWDERNLRPQESNCNEFLHGNMAVFTQRLDAECKGITDILKSDMRLVHKPTRDEIRQVIAEFSPKVTLMKKQLKT